MNTEGNTRIYIPRVWQVLVTVFFVLAYVALFIHGVHSIEYLGGWPPVYDSWYYSFYEGNATGTIFPVLFTALAMIGGIVSIWINKSIPALGCACVYAIDEIIYIVTIGADFTYPSTGFYIFSVCVIALFVFIIMAKKKEVQGVRSANTAKAPVEQKTVVEAADEISKYKSLLDSGAITQEEYDKKKKQLLGL